jgi:hypothetical protein
VAEVVKAHPAHPCTPQRLSEAAQQRRMIQRLAGVWIGKDKVRISRSLIAAQKRVFENMRLSAAYLLRGSPIHTFI